MQINEYAEIKGLEIFKIGTRETGDYTESDLDNMVAKANAGIHDAPTVISHDENQDLLAADKLPAAGWLKKLYRQGQSLFADLSDVPRVVAGLIEKRALTKRSIEIYNDFVDDKGNHHGKVVRRLALLGGAIPRIKSLSDHLALYEETTDQDLSVFSFSEMNDTIEGDLKRREFDIKVDEIYYTFRDKLWGLFYDPEATDDDKKGKYRALIDELDKLINQAFEDTLGKFSEKPNNKEEVTMTPEEQEKIKQDAIKKFAEEFAAKNGISPEEAVQKYHDMQKTAIENEIRSFSEDLKHKGLAPKIVDEFQTLISKEARIDTFAEGETVYDGLKKLMTSVASAVADKSAYVEFKEQGKTDQPKNAAEQHENYGEDIERKELADKAKKYAEENKVGMGEALEVVAQQMKK